jgi:hypothetical protein
MAPEILACWDRDGMGQIYDAHVALYEQPRMALDGDGVITVWLNYGFVWNGERVSWLEFRADPVPHWRTSATAGYFGYFGSGYPVHPVCHQHGESVDSYAIEKHYGGKYDQR